MIAPTRNARRTTPRRLAPREGPEAERIEATFTTPEDRALYRRRQQIVERSSPTRRWSAGATRFRRGGLSACRAEWRPLAATHNLVKLWRVESMPA